MFIIKKMTYEEILNTPVCELPGYNKELDLPNSDPTKTTKSSLLELLERAKENNDTGSIAIINCALQNDYQLTN